MKGDSRNVSRKSQQLPKTPQGKAPVPHDTTTLIEESVVWLHALQEWGELNDEEKKFLHTALLNLAKMHRRRAPGT